MVDLSPNAVYYLILYVFVLVLRFFKTYPTVRDHPEMANWRHYFFVSVDIVYTSAGVALLLLAAQPDWIAVIMMGYAFLLVVSAFLDSVGARFSDWSRFIAHVTVIAVVAMGTVLAFTRVLDDPRLLREAQAKESQRPASYRVAMPYADLTLDRHLGGGKLDQVTFGFFTTVEATSRDTAAVAAKAKFLESGPDSPKLFSPEKPKTAYNASFRGDDLVVERVH